MKKNSLNSFTASFFLLLVAACGGKDELSVPPEADTRSRLLGKWQTMTVVKNGDAQKAECATDDIFEFKDNKKVSIQFKKSCEGRPEGHIGEYPYEISADGKTVTIFRDQPRNADFDQPRTITKLTSDALEYEYAEKVGGLEFKYKISYKKIQ